MAEPIALDDLVRALGLAGADSGELISLVGGGGKTTTMFALGRQLSGPTVVTTTTKMGSDRTDGYPLLVAPTDAELVTAVVAGPTLVWSETGDHRATGVRPEDCDRWFALAGIDNVVVEADGSRRRPFKAPAGHEPVVPSASTTLIACIGVGALNQPIAERCHRPELLAALTDCSVQDRLTAARAAVVLTHPDGSRKGCGERTRFVIAICGATADHMDDVDQLVEAIGDQAETVVIAATASR